MLNDEELAIVKRDLQNTKLRCLHAYQALEEAAAGVPRSSFHWVGLHRAMTEVAEVLSSVEVDITSL